ncbi:MAG: 50S ribosomal protein L31 [Chloroflexota bacterium]
MKKDLHPKWFPMARVVCACGNTWEVGATQEALRTDVCNQCHPFYTGQQQRIIDSAGVVERFMQRVDRAQTLRAESVERAKARAERARARRLVDLVDEAESVEPLETAGTEQ